MNKICYNATAPGEVFFSWWFEFDCVCMYVEPKGRLFVGRDGELLNNESIKCESVSML